MSETSKPINKILGLPLEIRLWIETKCRDDITNSEIITLLNEKFPYVEGITPQNIASFRKKICPNYKELLLERYGKKAQKPEAEIEEEILEAVRESEALDAEFSIEEKKKMNLLKSTKTVLKEMWDNYRRIRNTTDEQAKKGYLVEISKVLVQVRELEAQERDILSSFAEIRKSEAKLTLEQYEDSIKGWFILRASEKAPTKEEAIQFLERLKVYLDQYKLILEKSTDKDDAVRTMLQQLYVLKKVTAEEKPLEAQIAQNPTP